MQTKTKKKIIIADSALLLFMIIGIVFAWFASNYSNSVNSNEVTVLADGALELSVSLGVDKSWSNSILLSNYDAFKNVKFLDITGIGDGNFLRPTLTQNVAGYAEVVNEDTKWSTPTPCDFSKSTVIGDYVKFTLYMRSEDPLDVYLGDGSYVEPVAKKLMGTGTENVSPFSTLENPFSKDIVVGAVRVSACKTGTNQRIFTWIPKPEYYVDAATSEVTYDKISLNASSGLSYDHQYYAADHNILTLNDATLIKSKITESNEKLIATLEKKDGDTYYTGSTDFYIWLEGCDNEARRAFVDGKFKLYLNIVSKDAATN